MCQLFSDSRAILAISDNEWTNDKLNIKWLRHFNRYTPSIGAYRLLILDNHRNHATITFIDYTYKNKIILLYLLSHSTHRLQPLNIAIFSSLATYYSHEVNAYNRCEGKDISKRE